MVEDARLDGGEVRVLKELTLLQAALPKPLKLRAHHSALLFLTSSPHSISLSGPESALFGGALWTGCARGSCRGKGGPACLLLLVVQATLDPRTGRGRRILGVTSFSCPASNPKLWKFQAPLQGLRVDTSPHTHMTALHGQGWHGRATNGGSGWQVGNVGWGKASPNTSQPAPTSTFPTQEFYPFSR